MEVIVIVYFFDMEEGGDGGIVGRSIGSMGEMWEMFVDKMECFVYEVGDGSVGFDEKVVEEVFVEILVVLFGSMFIGVFVVDELVLICVKVDFIYLKMVKYFWFLILVKL